MALGQSVLWPLASKPPRKGQILSEQQEGPLRPVVTGMIVNVGGENQEVTEARGPRGKELAHFVDQHHKLPEEPVLKWIMSNRLGGCVLGSECFQVEEHVWAAAGHTAHYQQSQVGVCDPDTREGTRENSPPGGRHKNHCKACSPCEGVCPSPPINAKWNTLVFFICRPCGIDFMTAESLSH